MPAAAVVVPFGDRSTTSALSSPATPPRSTNSSKPSKASVENCVRLANKLQVLALLHPRGLRAVEERVNQLLAEVSDRTASTASLGHERAPLAITPLRSKDLP